MSFIFHVPLMKAFSLASQIQPLQVSELRLRLVQQLQPVENEPNSDVILQHLFILVSYFLNNINRLVTQNKEDHLTLLTWWLSG